MKALITLLSILFIHSNAGAVTIAVEGRNGERLLQVEITPKLPLNVGQISEQVFQSKEVPYQGDASGFSALFHLGQDLEVISNTEMKAYGWCFSIDGFVPETMPDQTAVLKQETQIIWYYAYAHYKDGAWIGQCVKTAASGLPKN